MIVLQVQVYDGALLIQRKGEAPVAGNGHRPGSRTVAREGVKAVVWWYREFVQRVGVNDEVDHLEQPLDQIAGQSLWLACFDKSPKRLVTDALNLHAWKVSLYTKMSSDTLRE